MSSALTSWEMMENDSNTHTVTVHSTLLDERIISHDAEPGGPDARWRWRDAVSAVASNDHVYRFVIVFSLVPGLPKSIPRWKTGATKIKFVITLKYLDSSILECLNTHVESHK